MVMSLCEARWERSCYKEAALQPITETDMAAAVAVLLDAPTLLPKRSDPDGPGCPGHGRPLGQPVLLIRNPRAARLRFRLGFGSPRPWPQEANFSRLRAVAEAPRPSARGSSRLSPQ